MYYLISKIAWKDGKPLYDEVKYLETKKDAIDFNNIQTKKQSVEYICVKPNEEKGALEKATDLDKPEG